MDLLRAILLLTMLAPYNAFAAVVISSGNIESTTITIVGSGFGAHGDFGEAETYLPYIFEDCGSNGYLTNKSFTCDGVITSENSRSLEDNRSILHVRDDLNPTNITACDGDELADSTNRNTLKYNVEGKAAIHQYFVSEWVYIPTDFYTRIGDDTSNQIKVNLITPIDDPTARQYFNFYGSDILYTNTEVGELAGNEGTMSEIMPAGTWHRLDIFVSIPNETTSFEDKIIFWVDGNNVRETTYLGHGGVQIDEQVSTITFPGYFQQFGDKQTFPIQTDDHFIDFTMARVEISDYPTWDETAQHHKELQIPTVWSDTGVTANLNLGSFQDGDHIYLYVVDADGAVNADGYDLGILGAETNVTKQHVGYSSTGRSWVYSPTGVNVQ